MNLQPYIRARYPILYLVTPEESRAELAILNTAREVKYKLRIWSHTEGFTNPDGKDAEQTEDPIEALLAIKGGPNNTIYVARDLPAFFSSEKVVRLLRDIARDFKQTTKTLIITSPVRRLPPDLERDVTLLEFDLPGREEIEHVFTKLYEPHKAKIGAIPDEEKKERIIQAAMGLTTVEAENAIAKAVVESVSQDKRSRPPISKLVLKEKSLAVRKTGILEYFEAAQTAEDIGGLENLKHWLTMRSKAFSGKARAFKLPMPRGMLLVGIPGCGKSLSAKAASNIMGVPLIRFDIGRVFGGLVGESESNMRLAVQTAEAIGSCVLWIDEMEKAFAGMGGGSTDGGTSQRVFGNFLSWMQEKTKPCFVIATINRIEGLPPELLRKGRFDEIFFVGLPTAKERADILRIHIQKFGRQVADFAKELDQMVMDSEGFSGAELEEAVVSGLYSAFYHDQELSSDDILKAIRQTNPLSKSKAPELGEMVKWAETNALNASRVESGKASGKTSAGRQLDI